jgi:hypothetical protein
MYLFGITAFYLELFTGIQNCFPFTAWLLWLGFSLFSRHKPTRSGPQQRLTCHASLCYQVVKCLGSSVLKRTWTVTADGNLCFHHLIMVDCNIFMVPTFQGFWNSDILSHKATCHKLPPGKVLVSPGILQSSLLQGQTPVTSEAVLASSTAVQCWCIRSWLLDSYRWNHSQYYPSISDVNQPPFL